MERIILEDQIGLFTPENFNKATEIIFELISKVTKLKGGSVIEGSQKESYLKMSIYLDLIGGPFKKEDDWGEVAVSDISNFEIIEEFFGRLIQYLKKLDLLKNEYTFSDDLQFTKNGYISFLKIIQNNDQYDFFKSELSASEDEVFGEVNEETKDFDEKLDIDVLKIESIILEKIYKYESIFSKKIHFSELFFRVLLEFNPGLNIYDTSHEVQQCKKFTNFEDVKELVRNNIYTLFRRDLIYYDDKLSNFINITKQGKKFLSEGTYEEEIKKPELKTTTFIHLTDLHFGSFEDTGVDNKDKLEDISGLKIPNTKFFLQAIKHEIDENTFLVVSGDLTSKNEQEGYIAAKMFLKSLGIKDNKIYVVPGNHDYARNQDKINAFATFKFYFDDFHNPLHKDKYIIDTESKVFIYGFNSVQINKVGEQVEEVIYVHRDDINKFEDICNELVEKNPEFVDFIKIAVVHHNMTDHPGIEFKKYSHAVNAFDFKRILMQNRFTGVLSGHKHTPLIERQELYIDEFHGKLMFLSGGSLFGMTGSNSFQILKVHSDIHTNDLHSVEIHKFSKNSMGEFNKNKEPIIIPF
jgi:predicted MPP superfamily phosphohydrolase